MTTTVAEAPVADTTIETVSELLNSVADAMKDAVDGPPEATGDARRGVLSRTAYSTFYYTSYGIVFSTLFAARLIPGFGIVSSGLIDGATAASAAIRKRNGAEA